MRKEATPQPLDKRRIVGAFLLSPLIVVGALSLLLLVGSFVTQGSLSVSMPWDLVIIGGTLVVAYAHELLIALPIFLILKKRMNASLPICICFGFAIGMLPTQILNSFNGTPLDLRPLMIPSLIGAAIGYIFWRIGLKPVDSK